jgi:PIN domain nuclease of toxin-antitoxin system
MGGFTVILLDTHVLIWLVEGLPDLGKKARTLAEQAFTEDGVAVSALSFWEVAMLHQKGRIALTHPLQSWRNQLLELGFQELPINGDIAIAATTLANFHADPADRFITATALLWGASFLTADHRILQWKGTVHRINASR